MEAENIEWVFVGGIDNILLKIIDPLFLGLTIANDCEIASKSIRKLIYLLKNGYLQMLTHTLA